MPVAWAAAIAIGVTTSTVAVLLTTWPRTPVRTKIAASSRVGLPLPTASMSTDGDPVGRTAALDRRRERDQDSIGAAGLFMRSLTGNPMDVHLHTGANLRRYLLRLEGVSLRNKLLALLTWHTGPEVRSTQNRMEPPPQPNPEAVAALPHRTQAALLDALEESIYTQPPTDWSKVTNLGLMRAVPEVKNTVNLAQQYADLGYDPDALISRLATIVVHDNFTEMHAFKHHQATFEEFHATRLPWRWRHLVSAAQASAISYGKNMEIYEEALELLHG